MSFSQHFGRTARRRQQPLCLARARAPPFAQVPHPLRRQRATGVLRAGAADGQPALPASRHRRRDAPHERAR
eukprot:4161997-Alexandrium_andersonii.AAC.1